MHSPASSKQNVPPALAPSVTSRLPPTWSCETYFVVHHRIRPPGHRRSERLEPAERPPTAGNGSHQPRPDNGGLGDNGQYPTPQAKQRPTQEWRNESHSQIGPNLNSERSRSRPPSGSSAHWLDSWSRRRRATSAVCTESTLYHLRTQDHRVFFRDLGRTTSHGATTGHQTVRRSQNSWQLAIRIFPECKKEASASSSATHETDCHSATYAASVVLATMNEFPRTVAVF